MRYRHDGFTAKKRRRFLKALGKMGCIRDAAKVAVISTTTVDRWRAKDKSFDRQCVAALDMAASRIEPLAWERGVTGIEEPVIYYGKVVGMRLKRSDSIFRMILMASNPKKYGRMGAVKRKQIEKELRKRVEREVRAELEDEQLEAGERTRDEARDSIMTKLANMRRGSLKKGWTETPEGALVPPGWGPITDEAKAAVAEAEAKRLQEGQDEPESRRNAAE